MASTGAKTDLDSSLGNLRAECEKIWHEVKETQQQLNQARPPALSAQMCDQQPSISILREEERRLRAEIFVTKEMSPSTLPNDNQIIEAAFLEVLQKEIGQLQQTLSLVGSQHQELQTSLEQEQQYEKQLLTVSEKLQEKSIRVEAEEPPEDAAETLAQELEVKINTARKMERTVMKKMGNFVGKHFPIPQSSEVAQTSKNLRSKKHQSHRETLPLKDVLLELMTKCVDSPSDPYLQLTDNHWPAYIELLLRCNIILQHPDDDRCDNSYDAHAVNGVETMQGNSVMVDIVGYKLDGVLW